MKIEEKDLSKWLLLHEIDFKDWLRRNTSILVPFYKIKYGELTKMWIPPGNKAVFCYSFDLFKRGRSVGIGSMPTDYLPEVVEKVDNLDEILSQDIWENEYWIEYARFKLLLSNGQCLVFTAHARASVQEVIEELREDGVEVLAILWHHVYEAHPESCGTSFSKALLWKSEKCEIPDEQLLPPDGPRSDLDPW